MKQIRYNLCICLIGLACGLYPLLLHAQIKVENLGEPIRVEVPIEFVTRDRESGAIAWGGFAGADRYGIVGVHTVTGAVKEIDLSRYGKTIRPVQVFKHNDKQIFIFAGDPGRFFKYDIPEGKLAPVGEPTAATFWFKKGGIIGSSGNIYVGTYPRATVVVLNPSTGSVSQISQIAEDRSLTHAGQPACSSDGMLYFPVGMLKGQLWSYNPVTKKKQQILPQSLQTYGLPVLWQGADGQVYGRKGDTVFVCSPTGIRYVQHVKRPPDVYDNEVDGKIALLIDKDGRLVLKEKATGEQTRILTSFRMPAAAGLYRLGGVRDGKLFGSSYRPGITFTYDLRTGKFEDLGILTTGKIVVYDYLSHKRGIFMSSYTGGHIDFYPAGKELVPKNKKHVVSLHATENQERLRQLMLGPDGMVYSPSGPLKGMLGGRLTRIDPESLEVTSYKDSELIEHQSYQSATAVPETNELFITTSIQGGTGAKPITTEAYVFLWDTQTKSVSFRTQPLLGSSSYGRAARAPNGIIYGFSGNRYYAFDARQRKTIFTGVLERPKGSETSHVLLCEFPASDGLIYGVDAVLGNVIVIDPANHKVTVRGNDPSLINTRFVEVYSDGYLYYGQHAALMRIRVSGPTSERNMN